MTFFLDWAVANDLDGQIDTIKIECWLLASVADPAHAAISVVNGMTNDGAVAEYNEIKGEPRSDIPLDDHPVVMAHHVFWATRFGQEPVTHQEAEERVLALISDETDPDAVGVLLVACVGLGITPDVEWEERLVTGVPESWATYHPHLVAAYYHALRETV